MVEGLARLGEELAKMNEWAKGVIFDQEGRIIASKGFNVDPKELTPYLHCLDSRDVTIGSGFILNKQHFEVHRYHPPLVFGRRGGPDEGEGIAICQALRDGAPVYGLITYELPILSARAVPQLIEFCRKYIGTVEIPGPN
ncbi:hypothetical protein SteCoe_7319 [Stentor coeruleus]|uniref:Profilin n=1 Tax=Stentor coeruleus TaxID=5963 RepID=A0A1R2CMY2_9CILI|nr:hypothetical protein SteCoe_7319 [Stentor coeruleus]